MARYGSLGDGDAGSLIDWMTGASSVGPDSVAATIASSQPQPAVPPSVAQTQQNLSTGFKVTTGMLVTGAVIVAAAIFLTRDKK